MTFEPLETRRWMGAHQRRLLLIATLSLGACTHITYEPQPADSPMFAPTTIGFSSCRNPDRPAGPCWLVVQSEARFNDSDLQLTARQCLTVRIPPHQFLYDDTRRVPMPQGDEGSFNTMPWRHLQRNAEQKWFALMASLDGDEATAISVINGTVICGGQLEVSANNEILADDHPRRLSFWVNDWHSKYDNNQGRLWLQLTPVP